MSDETQHVDRADGAPRDEHLDLRFAALTPSGAAEVAALWTPTIACEPSSGARGLLLDLRGNFGALPLCTALGLARVILRKMAAAAAAASPSSTGWVDVILDGNSFAAVPAPHGSWPADDQGDNSDDLLVYIDPVPDALMTGDSGSRLVSATESRCNDLDLGFGEFTPPCDCGSRGLHTFDRFLANFLSCVARERLPLRHLSLHGCFNPPSTAIDCGDVFEATAAAVRAFATTPPSHSLALGLSFRPPVERDSVARHRAAERADAAVERLRHVCTRTGGAVAFDSTPGSWGPASDDDSYASFSAAAGSASDLPTALGSASSSAWPHHDDGVGREETTSSEGDDDDDDGEASTSSSLGDSNEEAGSTTVVDVRSDCCGATSAASVASRRTASVPLGWRPPPCPVPPPPAANDPTTGGDAEVPKKKKKKKVRKIKKKRSKSTGDHGAATSAPSSRLEELARPVVKSALTPKAQKPPVKLGAAAAAVPPPSMVPGTSSARPALGNVGEAARNRLYHRDPKAVSVSAMKPQAASSSASSSPSPSLLRAAPGRLIAAGAKSTSGAGVTRPQLLRS